MLDIQRYIKVNLLSNFIIIIFSLLFAIKFYNLSNGDVLNFYPLISPDGFDWYTEGIYLYKSFSYEDLIPLPVLRPPFFVFVTFLDFIFGEKGLILSIIYMTSIVFSFYSIVWIVKNENNKLYKNNWFIFPILIAFTIHPINFHKAYLLSDSFAVCVSLLSVVFFIKFKKINKLSYFYVSSIFALISTLTQIYALIPYMCYVLFYIFTNNNSLKKNISLLAPSCIFILVTYIAITFFWYVCINHNITPTNFSLLKLNFNMLNFYLNTWVYYFSPFILFILFYPFKFRFNQSGTAYASISTFIIFTILCLCYQWPESRFSYLIWPWFIISFFTIIFPRYTISSSVILSLFLVLISLFNSPNPWQPMLKNLVFGYEKNWYVEFLSLTPTDRGLNKCFSVSCSNRFIDNSNNYVQSVMNTYLILKNDTE